MISLIWMAFVVLVAVTATYLAVPDSAAEPNVPAVRCKPHYFVAGTIGTVLGALLVVAVGFLSAWNGTGWEIPAYVQVSEQTANLWYQAAILRTCHLVLQQGLTFIAIPVVSCCGIAKLITCLPGGSGRGRFLARTFWIYLCCAVVAFTCGCVAACFHIPAFINEIVVCILWGIGTVFLTTVCGALPAVALLISLIAEGIRNNPLKAISDHQQQEATEPIQAIDQR